MGKESNSENGFFPGSSRFFEILSFSFSVEKQEIITILPCDHGDDIINAFMIQVKTFIRRIFSPSLIRDVCFLCLLDT